MTTRHWLDLNPVPILVVGIAAICLTAILMVTPILVESWQLGGPGTRHVEDIHPLVRGGWDR